NSIQFIQAISQSSSGSSVTATPVNNVTMGNTLIAYGCVYNATPGSTAVSDSQGNTWSLIKMQSGASAAAGGAGLWIASNVAGGNTTVTFSAGASRCKLDV